MKTLLSFLTLVFLSITLFAQLNDILVFSEKGEKFYMYVNSVKQNETPMANVKGKDIQTESFIVRIVFEDKSLPEITQNFWTESKNVEISAIVTQNRKGKYILRYNGEKNKSAVTENIQTNNAVYEDPTKPQTKPSSPARPANQRENQINMDMDISEDKVSLNTGTGHENVSINMTVSDKGMDIDLGTGEENIKIGMEVSEESIKIDMGASETGVNFNMNVKPSNIEIQHDMHTETEIIYEETTVQRTAKPETRTSSRCATAMSAVDFKDAQESIKSKSFEDSKLTIAKQISKNSCLTSEQIRDIMKVFSFEETKLDFAKYAFDYVFNPGNFYKVNEAFTFEMTIDELNEFLESK